MMKEPYRRGNAIRVMSDFSLNDLFPVIYEVIQKGINDQSPYVRRIALNGLVKVRISHNRCS